MTAIGATSDPLPPAVVAGLLRSSLAAVTAEVGALGPAQLSWRPTPDDWCINEVIGHLIEAERRGFAGRIQTIVEQDQPLLEPWDQSAVASARRDCERNGRELLHELVRERLASLALIASLTDAQLERSGLHPAVGRLTVRDLLHEWVFHDRAHAKQIFDNVAAMAWPHMGNSRRFSQPNLLI